MSNELRRRLGRCSFRAGETITSEVRPEDEIDILEIGRQTCPGRDPGHTARLCNGQFQQDGVLEGAAQSRRCRARLGRRMGKGARRELP